MRVVGQDAAAVTQASLTSIIYEVTDLSDSSQIATGTLTIANVINDTLQTPTLDPRWTIDSIGFNFEYNNPRTELPNPDRSYLFEFLFTPTSGQAWPITVELKTIKVYAATF